MNLSISLHQRLHDRLTCYVLPFGLIALMTGMFWIGDRSNYHKLYYLLVALPTFVALAASPRTIKQTSSNGIFLCFLALSAYTMLSLSWSGTDNPHSSLFKRPLYIALLFYCIALISIKDKRKMETLINMSIWLAALSAIISIAHYFNMGYRGRIKGYGALYNHLLTSHVYGMFAALALASTFLRNRNLLISLGLFTILAIMLLMIGARTPFLGLCAAFLWLSVIDCSRRSLWLLTGAGIAAATLFAFAPKAIMARGLSHRPEIWVQAWQQILEHPWLGHGYDHPMVFWVKGFKYAFADPHNMELALLFSGGVVGLSLWLLLYGVALRFAWRHRQDRLVVLASTAVVFGFAAGLTEGNSFMSRPKEHWFLIWIPMALLAGAWLTKPDNVQQRHEPTAG
ncbi:hypothetical protein D3C78_796170 [compost metagenome]